MFASVFYDRYTRKEVGEVAYAITDLFNPFNNPIYGWSPASVYLLWNPATREPLYVGYSLNVARRFAEHHGLTPCEYAACKYHQIDDYFSDHEHLAVSLLVQGSEVKVVDPAKLNDASKVALLESPFTIEKSFVTDIEARLITSFANATGAVPTWNENRGSVSGQQKVDPADVKLLRLMAGQNDPLVARGTLRQIASAPWYEGAEHYLHGHRLVLINTGMCPAAGMIPRYWDPIDPDHGQKIEQYLTQEPFAWK